MKELKHSALVVMIFVCLFFCLGTNPALAEVTYVGEFCFSIRLVDGAPPTPMKLGVLSYGDGHYMLNGIWDNAFPIYGTGFIRDNIATISLVSSSTTTFSASHIVLDLNTWSGTMYPVFPTSSSGSSFGLIAGPC